MTQFLSGAGNWPPDGIFAAREEINLFQSILITACAVHAEAISASDRAYVAGYPEVIRVYPSFRLPGDRASSHFTRLAGDGSAVASAPPPASDRVPRVCWFSLKWREGALR
jgi:hypothetical protein